MKYSAVKGMQDILPPAIYTWHKVEEAARRAFRGYGFQEMRFPVMEPTEVFSRGIGDTTDIVEKEMYTFTDKGGRSLSLRPEGTAPAVRCYIQNRLYTLPSPQKFYYMGPMFRYERPQKGRLRQFYQIGAEAFGSAEPAADAEVVAMLVGFFSGLGLAGISLQLNSIGCPTCRPAYRDALKDFFAPRLDALCPDCKRRWEKNPLRILDCKVPGCVEQRKGAPVVSDFLCEKCRSHFSSLTGFLEALGVAFTVTPSLVRGLDYYTGTIFEVVAQGLGAQNAVAAGGRYDLLVEEFGGPPTPAIGFAVGMERLVELVGGGPGPAPAPDVFIACLGAQAQVEALKAAGALRASGRWAEVGGAGDSLKSQMRRADRLGAGYVIVIGEDELKSGSAGWKRLKDGATGRVELEAVASFYGPAEAAA